MTSRVAPHILMNHATVVDGQSGYTIYLFITSGRKLVLVICFQDQTINMVSTLDYQTRCLRINFMVTLFTVSLLPCQLHWLEVTIQQVF